MFPCESPQIRRAVFFIPGPQSQVTYPLSMPKMAELALSDFALNPLSGANRRTARLMFPRR